jgi:acyl dehydratase
VQGWPTRKEGLMDEWSFPVEAGHIMMFARSVGDPNPVYYDEAAGEASEVGAIVAPPTFIQASAQFNPDYFLRPQIGHPWFGSGKEPTGVQRAPAPAGGGGGGGGVGLHAEQHYEYHRPIRAGDVLTSTTKAGRSWERTGRSGHLQFSESVTEWYDAEGSLVLTARSVGVRTSGPAPSSEEKSN